MQLLKKLTLFKVHKYIYSILIKGGNSYILWAPHFKKDVNKFGTKASDLDGKDSGNDKL